MDEILSDLAILYQKLNAVPVSGSASGGGGGASAGTPETGQRLTKEGFLKIAERVLPRRDVAVDDATRAQLGRIYDWAIRPGAPE